MKKSLTPSRTSFLKINKYCTRPSPEHVDRNLYMKAERNLYIKLLNESFKLKIEMIQYNAVLIITSVIKELLMIKCIKSLVWSYRQFGDGQKVILFHETILGLLPSYHQEYVSIFKSKENTKLFHKTKHINLFLKHLFFPHYAKERRKASKETRDIDSINKFKSYVFNFIMPRENSVFVIHDTKGVKFLTRLRFNFSHLNIHKFWHNFNDMTDPMCL